jgi:DNA-binding NarL/FixJ family response regulator
MLWEVYDHVEIHIYKTMEEMIRDSNRHFVHFFVSTEILFSNADEFEMLKDQTTVLAEGSNEAILKAGFKILDCTSSEKALRDRLMEIELERRWYMNNETARKRRIADRLSEREKEVLILIVKGMINKEIAVNLGISQRTVETHKNNIFKKLGINNTVELMRYMQMRFASEQK